MRYLALILLILLPASLSARIPTMGEVHQAALRHGRYDHRELQDWKSGSRWSAALPRLQVGFDRSLKDVVSLTTSDNVSISGGEVFVGPDENKFDQDFNQGTSFDVRAVWYLDELVFSKDRLDVNRETRNWMEDRSRLLERVTDYYFGWKRGKSAAEREEYSARLDVYTGGWFSEELRKK